jgi:flagellin-like protein
MYMMNRHFNNRAVSQVIAALLLIAIAVAAAILVYVFSIGLLGSLQGGGGQQVKEQVIAEAYNWLTPGSLILQIRNVGTSGVTIASVYINGVAATTPLYSTGCPSGVIPVQTGCTMTVTVPAAASAATGVAYTIKVISIDGAVFSYSAVDGQAS